MVEKLKETVLRRFKAPILSLLKKVCFPKDGGCFKRNGFPLHAGDSAGRALSSSAGERAYLIDMFEEGVTFVRRGGFSLRCV